MKSSLTFFWKSEIQTALPETENIYTESPPNEINLVDHVQDVPEQAASMQTDLPEAIAVKEIFNFDFLSLSLSNIDEAFSEAITPHVKELKDDDLQSVEVAIKAALQDERELLAPAGNGDSGLQDLQALSTDSGLRNNEVTPQVEFTDEWANPLPESSPETVMADSAYRVLAYDFQFLNSVGECLEPQTEINLCFSSPLFSQAEVRAFHIYADENGALKAVEVAAELTAAQTLSAQSEATKEGELESQADNEIPPAYTTVTIRAKDFSVYALLLMPQTYASGKLNEEPLRVPSASQIYLNGQNGNDANDGSSADAAVRSFARAKELAMKNSAITDILVTGTTELEGDISLQGTMAAIKRENNFGGYLFNVAMGKSATLHDLTIDGESSADILRKALIKVNGHLNIQDGTVLQNNRSKAEKNMCAWGGAIEAYEATVSMSGGLIQNNEATNGGGIYLGKSSMELSGGQISKNHAKRVSDTFADQIYAAGGGIALYHGSTLTISGQPLIESNVSDEVGGGISAGTRQASYGHDCVFMNGGIIRGNSAGASGGGLFVQAGLNNVHNASATITAGQIINNVMNGNGYTEKTFGGGGIYVNGGPETWLWQGNEYHMRNGELQISNALIEDNTADQFGGGGLAACPVSKTYVYLTEGAAIIGNHTTPSPQGDDIFIYSNLNFGAHSGLAEYEIATRMLGGTPYLWHDYYDNPVPDERLKGTLADKDMLVLTATGQISAEARQLATVVISGNHSNTRGGGIGSNGTVIIGKKEEKKDLQVIKTWGQGLNPQPITVELRGKSKNSGLDWLIEAVELNESNQFSHVFRDLAQSFFDPNSDVSLYIREPQSDQYQVTLSPFVTIPQGKTLSFTLKRPQFSKWDNLNATYSNYYMKHPEAGIFDSDKWELKDFTVKYSLLDEKGESLAESSMSYVAKDYQWNEKAAFAGIPVKAETLEIQYYDNQGQLVEPWLLQYNLYLERHDDKTILKVPKLRPTSKDAITGDEIILSVEDQKVTTPSRGLYQITIDNKKPEPPKPTEPTHPTEPTRPTEPCCTTVRYCCETTVPVTKASVLPRTGQHELWGMPLLILAAAGFLLILKKPKI